MNSCNTCNSLTQSSPFLKETPLWSSCLTDMKVGAFSLNRHMVAYNPTSFLDIFATFAFSSGPLFGVVCSLPHALCCRQALFGGLHCFFCCLSPFSCLSNSFFEAEVFQRVQLGFCQAFGFGLCFCRGFLFWQGFCQIFGGPSFTWLLLLASISLQTSLLSRAVCLDFLFPCLLLSRRGQANRIKSLEPANG